MKKTETIEQSKKESTEKWYDNPNLSDFLLFVIPPVGLYCVFKSKNIVPKPVKIFGGLIVFSGMVWLIISYAQSL